MKVLHLLTVRKLKKNRLNFRFVYHKFVHCSYNFHMTNMIQKNDHLLIAQNKKVRHVIDFIVTIMTIVDTICYIIVVKFNRNITGNPSIDLMREILLFTYRFQQRKRF